jgi:hypothetical protein
MKAQDKYPYDSTILGLNGIYQTIGNDSFYINSHVILATDKIITEGKEYIIFDYSPDTGIKMSDVALNDCYYYEGLIYLIVQDIRSQEVFTIDQRLECPENDCTWILVDMDYLRDLMNAKAIRDYCGCDSKTKRTNGKSNPEATDDLLELEF